MKDEKPEFVAIGDAAQAVVQKIRRAMEAQRWHRYQVPATEDDRRLTRRMCGEREDD